MSTHTTPNPPSAAEVQAQPHTESHDDCSRRRLELREKLAHAINYTSTENASNTPDFILAEYLVACLDAFAGASNAREKWYGKSLSICGDDHARLLADEAAPCQCDIYQSCARCCPKDEAAPPAVAQLACTCKTDLVFDAACPEHGKLVAAPAPRHAQGWFCTDLACPECTRDRAAPPPVYMRDDYMFESSFNTPIERAWDGKTFKQILPTTYEEMARLRAAARTFNEQVAGMQAQVDLAVGARNMAYEARDNALAQLADVRQKLDEEHCARAEADRERGEMQNNLLKAADDIDMWRERAKRETDARLRIEEQRSAKDARIAELETDLADCERRCGQWAKEMRDAISTAADESIKVAQRDAEIERLSGGDGLDLSTRGDLEEALKRQTTYAVGLQNTNSLVVAEYESAKKQLAAANARATAAERRAEVFDAVSEERDALRAKLSKIQEAFNG